MFIFLVWSVVFLLASGSLVLGGWLWIGFLDRARQGLYAVMIDFLEVRARLATQADDQLKRDVEIVKAGYYLRQRRLELQSQRRSILELELSGVNESEIGE